MKNSSGTLSNQTWFDKSDIGFILKYFGSTPDTNWNQTCPVGRDHKKIISVFWNDSQKQNLLGKMTCKSMAFSKIWMRALNIFNSV